MSRAIPGTVDYRLLAEINKPTDPVQLAAEIQRLHYEQRLTPRDIAVSLRVDLGAVLNAISPATTNQETAQ